MDFIFCADVHLRQNLWRNDKSISGDTFYGLQQAVNYAKNYRVPLLIGGDLFDDKRPSSDTIVQCMDIITDAHSNGVTVWGINGNHDDCTPSWLDVVGIHRLDETGVTLNNLTFKGIDWTRDKESLHSKLVKCSDQSCDYLVLHQLVSEITGETLSDISIKGFPVQPARFGVLIGDYHTPSYVTTDKGFYGYPGSTCILNWGEVNLSKHVWGISHGSSVVNLPLLTRWMKRLRITSKAEQEDFFDSFREGLLSDLRTHRDKLPEGLRTGVLRLDVSDELTDFQDKFADIRRFAKVTDDELKLQITSISRTLLMDTRKTLTQGSVDPLDLIPLYLDPGKVEHQKVGLMARSLVTAVAPTEVIADITKSLVQEVASDEDIS